MRMLHVQLALLLALVAEYAFSASISIAAAAGNQPRVVTVTDYDGRDKDIAAVEAFQEWLEANGTSQADGVALARAWQPAFRSLMRNDPKAAVQYHSFGVPYTGDDGSRLPENVRRYFTVRTFDGKGMLYVACAVVMNGEATHTQDSYAITFRPDGTSELYQAYLYGFISKLATVHITAHGVVDGHAGIASLWQGPGSKAPVTTRVLSSGGNGTKTRIEVKEPNGTTLVRSFDVFGDLASFQSNIAALQTPSGDASNPQAKVQRGHGRKVLVVHVDFDDMAGFPIPINDKGWDESKTRSIMENDVNNFFKINSYNKLSYAFDYVPGVVRMPKTRAFYQSTFANYNFLFSDVAKAIKFNSSAYDTYVVLHGRMDGAVTFSGLAYVGLPGVLANGEFDVRVFCHEMGHNLGSWHANAWIASAAAAPNDNSYIMQGTPREYADQWAAMGIADSTGRRHFSARTKQYYTWIDSSKVLNLKVSGRYQLAAHDVVNALSANTLIIRVPVVSTIHKLRGLSYDIEYRSLPVQNNGGGVLLRYTLDPSVGFTMTTCRNSSTISDDCDQVIQSNGLIIDMTPNSVGDGYYDNRDGNLQTGLHFSDFETKLHVRIIGSPLQGDVPSQMVSVIYGTNNCWGQGTLQDGQCYCYSGHDGVDCSGTNNANVILHLYTPGGAFNATSFMSGLETALHDRNISEVLLEPNGDYTLLHLKFGNDTSKQSLRALVGNGDGALKPLMIAAAQEGDILTAWPYPYGQSSSSTIGGLPAWVVYLLGGLAALLALVLAIACIWFCCWRRRKAQKHTRAAPYYNSASLDMFGEEKASKDGFKPFTPPMAPRGRVSKAPEFEYETVHV